MKAMIFAAGLGTRLRPLTDHLPKALVPVGGKPLLEHVILRLKAAGFDGIVVNVHHFADMIIDFLDRNDRFGLHIDISDERDALLDTGGGIRRAARFLDDGQPFLVHNVDILSDLDLRALYDCHLRHEALATLAVSPRDTARYLLFDEGLRLHGWTNRLTGEVRPTGLSHPEGLRPLAFSGIHVLSPRVFGLMEDCGERFPIMDFYLAHAATQRLMGYVTEGCRLIDVGKPDTLAAAEIFLKSREAARFL